MHPSLPMLAAANGIIILASLFDGVSSFSVPLRPSRSYSIPGHQQRGELNVKVGSIRLRLSAEEETQPPSTNPEQTPLIDLQTFLKLCDLVQTGGEAKSVIQDGQVRLNWDVETRRAKKLFAGDEVSFGDTTLDVSDEVTNRGYVYKAKKKKNKPAAKVMEDGSLEFGGRYRSEEWRAERKEKKAERKSRNEGKE